jgi:hypothetical protein
MEDPTIVGGVGVANMTYSHNDTHETGSFLEEKAKGQPT